MNEGLLKLDPPICRERSYAGQRKIDVMWTWMYLLPVTFIEYHSPPLITIVHNTAQGAGDRR